MRQPRFPFLPLLLTAALGVPLGAGWHGLSGASQDETDLPVGWRQRQQLGQEQLAEALHGNWNLVEFRHATNDLSTVAMAGYLGVQEHLLTFFVHTTDPNQGLFGDPRRFQGGVHHWRISDALYLQTASLLSHGNFEGGALIFEPQYTPREYQPVVDGDELSLVRSDGSVLRFARVEAEPFPEAAVRILEAARDGLDPFENR